ncbi:hypothetical protein ACLB1T_07290 [Escherichia coli]
MRNELWILLTVGGCQRHRAANPEPFPGRDATTLKVPTACSSSATPTAAHSWATITLMHDAAQTWCATQRGRSAGDWSGL